MLQHICCTFCSLFLLAHLPDYHSNWQTKLFSIMIHQIYVADHGWINTFMCSINFQAFHHGRPEQKLNCNVVIPGYFLRVCAYGTCIMHVVNFEKQSGHTRLGHSVYLLWWDGINNLGQPMGIKGPCKKYLGSICYMVI